MKGFLIAQIVKKSACNAGDPGSIPVSGRSRGEGDGYPFQYSCLENSIKKSCTRLSNYNFHFFLISIFKFLHVSLIIIFQTLESIIFFLSPIMNFIKGGEKATFVMCLCALLLVIQLKKLCSFQ